MKLAKGISFIRDVIISDRLQGLYDIEGKEGTDGNTWWVLLKDEDEVIDELTADNFRWAEWDRSHNQISWNISFKQSSTVKHKWNSMRFRSHTECVIKQNGKHFYSFVCGGGDTGLSYAIAKAQYYITFLSEQCAYDFFNPESQAGRKILWHGLPATIQPNKEETHNITIHPDLSNMTKEEWFNSLYEIKRKLKLKANPQDEEDDREDNQEDYRMDYINWGDASADQHITWY